MKIYFCDKCNESIPIKALEDNRISIDAGKIYCEDCAPTKPARPRTSAGLWTVAVAVLLGVGLGMLAMVLWGDRLFGGEQRESIADQVARVERALDAHRGATGGRLDAIERDLEASPGVDGRAGKLAAAMVGIRDNSAAMQDLARRFEGFTDGVRSEQSHHRSEVDAFRAALEKRMDRIEDATDTRRLVEDLDALRERLDLAEKERAALAARLEEVARSTPRVNSGVAGPAAGAPTPTEEKLDPETERRLVALIEQLASKDAPKRFAAVVDLASVKSRRAEDAVVKALDDDADYVRTAALQSLMDANVRWAIPNVIQKLKDENFFVREATVAALEKLMGRSINHDPNATGSKVQAKIRELETWWTENRDKLP